MAFENATVTKGLMLGIALTTISVGIFDVKYFLNLQLSPHLSKYYQYWRLLTYHLACANSGDLLLVELLLYNAGIQIERAFGSVKYVSFIIVTTLISTITTFVCLLLLQIFRGISPAFNAIQLGPISITFSILFQYARLVPQTYKLRVFGAVFSDKIWIYILALQLAMSRLPSSVLPMLVGLFSGYMYRSDIVQLKGWRIPHRFQTFAEQWIQPVLGEERIQRRSNRVFPNPRLNSQSDARPSSDEMVTTARRPQRAQNEDRGQRRVADMATLATMFPDTRQEVIAEVVRRSPNLDAAAAILLSSRT